MEVMISMVSWCHVSSSLELPPSTMAITMLSKLWLKPITGRTASTFRPYIKVLHSNPNKDNILHRN